MKLEKNLLFSVATLRKRRKPSILRSLFGLSTSIFRTTQRIRRRPNVPGTMYLGQTVVLWIMNWFCGIHSCRVIIIASGCNSVLTMKWLLPLLQQQLWLPSWKGSACNTRFTILVILKISKLFLFLFLLLLLSLGYWRLNPEPLLSAGP